MATAKRILLKSNNSDKVLSGQIHDACSTYSVSLDETIEEVFDGQHNGYVVKYSPQYIPTLMGIKVNDDGSEKLIHEAPTVSKVGEFETTFQEKLNA